MIEHPAVKSLHETDFTDLFLGLDQQVQDFDNRLGFAD